MSINFQTIPEDKYVQLCFIRKYRQKEKTRYMFFNVNVSKLVSNSLKNWFETNISKIKGKTLEKYNPSITTENFEELDLSTIENWNFFKEKAFVPTKNEITLKEIKKQLVGFILYVKIDDLIFGQIRRLTPSAVLEKSLLKYMLFFDGQTFDDLKENVGLQIDEKADILFRYGDNFSNAIILNKDNFKIIFDVHEQEKKEAVKVFTNLKLLSKSVNATKIQKFIENDRQIQKMIINPEIQEHMSSFSFETLVKLKNEVSDKVNYEINESKDDFILPEGKEKLALKDIIKAMVGRYNQDLEGIHIFENSHVVRVLT